MACFPNTKNDANKDIVVISFVVLGIGGMYIAVVNGD